MGDSEEENDKDFASGLNITGFLFGNIDDNGQLEDDILDPEAKQQLASLSRLGLSSFISEMMQNESATEGKEDNEVEKNEEQNKAENNKDSDCNIKSPTAQDFSDINELADDTNDEARQYIDITILIYLLYVCCTKKLFGLYTLLPISTKA